MDSEKVNYHYCDDLPTTPLQAGTKILVTGANGYVARRLIPELLYRGYFVRCMYRNQRCPRLLDHPNIENVYADCLSKDELIPALEGIYVAYYLIHSMRDKRHEFFEKDKQAANNFVDAATARSIKKIIYLGGLGETNERLSQHLKSRMEVGSILAQSPCTVINLRAAIVIGAGSASYDLMKSLVLHNRWVPFLPEFNSKCQPVAIRDVIKYLVGVLETENLKTRVYHIGGTDVLTYKELIVKFAKILQRRVRFFDISWFPMPVDILCRVYAYWLHFFISVPVNITSLLLSSLRTDVVCKEDDIREALAFEPLGFETAVKWALEKEGQSRVFSHWSDAPPEKMSDLMPLCEFESANFIIDEQSILIPAKPGSIFPIICQVGGTHGWAHANFLWEIRGFIDRALGGVGLRRGRRDDKDLRVGDAVDFWRVERLEQNKELLLRAEMILPGLSWLQFELDPVSVSQTRLTLRSHFIPKPFWGNLYWVLLSRVHNYIFNGMLNYFHERAVWTQEAR